MTLQNILGRNYKWFYLFQYNFKIRLSSGWDSLLFVLGHLIILSGTILIWWLANGKVVDSNFENKLTYFLIGESLFCLIFNFASFEGFDILRGNHTKKLLLPSSYFKISFFKSYGESFLQSFSKLIFLILINFIFQKFIQTATINNFIVTVFFMPVSAGIFFLLELTVSFIAFWLTRINGIILNFGFLSSLLAGRLFPLNLLVENFWYNIFNPFAFIFYHPMQIYLGKYDFNQTILVFVGGIIWCILLFILARIIFKRGLKRNEAVGL
jgi:ABC-type uncharacterized transport system permease subunit